jgi:predicted 3-demethylubiquinone-9 3-methyltransferase (glyoxalase superfamily)
MKMQKIAPCLWFDDQAEETARFYTDIFRDSKILDISYYERRDRRFMGKNREPS